jgi:hypothetical protein
MEKSMAWNSPIDIIQEIVNDYNEKLLDNVVTQCIKVGITVDKDELLKALKYDREQYEKGYRDGKMDSHMFERVEEKLPNRTRDCLVVVEIGYFDEGFRTEVRSARYDAENNSWHVHRSEKPEYIGEVKAWMYTPIVMGTEDE